MKIKNIMINNLLKLVGWKITLIFGDTLVLDRWKWLSKKLPQNKTSTKLRILDVGCGSGAFSIGAASLGYDLLGLSWDEKNQNKASKRAKIFNKNASFDILDVRELHERKDLKESFNYIICAENIEHIINDQKLMNDMNNCLAIDGMLFLTAPNKDAVISNPIWGDETQDEIEEVEDGGHVRIGYDKSDFIELCSKTGFDIISIEYCSGFFSQKITGLKRRLSKINFYLSWIIIFPLRILPLFFDSLIKHPGHSICLVAKKK